MSIGLEKYEIQGHVSWELSTGYRSVDPELADKIADAVAKVIDKNNEEIATRLRAAGVKV